MYFCNYTFELNECEMWHVDVCMCKSTCCKSTLRNNIEEIYTVYFESSELGIENISFVWQSTIRMDVIRIFKKNSRWDSFQYFYHDTQHTRHDYCVFMRTVMVRYFIKSTKGKSMNEDSTCSASTVRLTAHPMEDKSIRMHVHRSCNTREFHSWNGHSS